MRIDPRIDYYRVLGVQPGASLTDIRKAYRSLAKVYHPDRTGDCDNEQFRRITLARDILSSPELRARYDKVRSLASDTGSPTAEPGTVPKAWQERTNWHGRNETSSGDRGTYSQVGRPSPQPPPEVSGWDYGEWFAKLFIGLAFCSFCLGSSVGRFFARVLGLTGRSSSLLVGLFAAFFAVGFLYYWALMLVELRRRHRFYRAYVAACERDAKAADE